jgi:hypothetical protein
MPSKRCEISQWRLRDSVENRISLVDLESGSVLLVLDQDASGESLVEVAWAPMRIQVRFRVSFSNFVKSP